VQRRFLSETCVLVRFVLACSLALALAAGCTQSAGVGPGGAAAPGVVYSGMVEYLESERVPELESVQRWDSGYGYGLKLTTAHYEVFTTLFEPSMLRRVPGFLEAAWRGYNDQLGRSLESRRRFRVYIFAQRQQWEAFTRAFTGDKAEIFCKIKAGAYYYNGSCVTYNIGRSRTFSALGHEGWHQFSDRHFELRLPSWLDEGLAMQFESPRVEKGRYVFDPDWNLDRLEGLAKTVGRGKIIRLRDLLAINPGQVLASERDEATAAFYSQSYALVRFLRESAGGARLAAFRRLLADGLTGRWPLDDVSKRIARDRNQPRTVLWNRIVGVGLFEKYIGAEIEQIEREYLAFCRGLLR